MIRDCVQEQVKNVIQSVTGELNILDLAPIAWYDATDASTITESGGLVSQWDDKSGNDNHLIEASPSFQPSIQQSYIYFDGTNKSLSVENFLTSGPLTLFVACKIFSTDDSLYILGNAGSGSEKSRYYLRVGFIDLGNNLISYSKSSEKKIITLNAGPQTDLSTQSIKINNKNEAESLVDRGQTQNDFSIGNNYTKTTGRFAEMNAYEVIFIARSITDAEAASVVEYLSQKHGINL